MAIKKTIEVDVLYTDVGRLEDALKAAGVQFDNLEVKSKGVKKEIKATAKEGIGSLSGLDSVTGGLGSKMDSATRSVKGFNIGLKGTRGAIIATGIGALIVLLGELIANWSTITEWFSESAKALSKYNDEVERAGRNKGILEDQIKVMEKQIELLKLTGQETFELERKRAIAILNNQKRAKKALDDGLKELQRVEKESQKLTFWQYWFGTGQQTQTDEKREALLKQRENVEKLRISLSKANLEAEKLSVGLEIVVPSKKPTGRADEEESESIDGLTDDGLDGLEARLQARAEMSEAFIDDEFALLGINERRKTRVEEEGAEARLKIAQIEFRNKQKLLFATADAAGAAGAIIGEQTVVGKALSVAGSLINTYASITGQLKAFAGVPIPGYAIAQAIATGLVGFRAVKDILAVDVPYSGGSGGSVSISEPQQPTVPSFNIVGDNPENQLADSVLNNENPIKAYVVEKEITSAQEAKRNKIETASFG